MSIAVLPAFAAEKFRPQPAASYATKQTSDGLTIAAVVYSDPEKLKPVFGKVNLHEFGLLPVLVVMQNDTAKALKLDTLELHYVTIDRFKVEETPASEVQYLDAPTKAPKLPGTSPLPIPTRKRKSKLAIPEITGYAFNAKMLPAGESAHGFVYFRVLHKPGSKVYIRGITDAASGRELLFFEVPLN
ncbi:MAG: hypothetical protein HY820_17660 [Acidobacteria bacterium]|nr:hypothetical protein [Acidobacteriota bacterium]